MQAQGPEFNLQNPCQKKPSMAAYTVITGAGETETSRSLGLTSLLYLASGKLRNSCLLEKVDSI